MKKTQDKNVFDLKLHHVYETLISVYDREDMPHHAPIGIRVRGIRDSGNYELEARIFATAKMYTELSYQKACTVHFPGIDQLEYYFLAFRDVLKDNVETIVKKTGVARTINAPVILDLKNYIEASVVSVQDEVLADDLSVASEGDSRLGVFSLKSSAIVVNDPRSLPVSRHGGMLLEFMVKASRLRYLIPASKKFVETRDELKKMLKKMENIAPGDENNVIAATILDQMDRGKD